MAKRRRSARQRGVYYLDYLIVLGVVGLAFATALVLVAAPKLTKTFREHQRAAAAPMP